MKPFDTYAVLSISHPRLMVEIGQIYDLLNHVLETEGLMTHHLPSAADAVRPLLVEHFDWIEGMEPQPAGDLDTLWAWGERIKAAHGETLEVPTASEMGYSTEGWVPKSFLDVRSGVDTRRYAQRALRRVA